MMRSRQKSLRSARQGMVLLATMVVIVLLALTAYHFSDATVQQLKAADAAHRATQARATADSGIHFAIGWLNNYAANVGMNGSNTDNPYFAPDVFQNVAVAGDAKKGFAGKFTLIAPVDPGSATPSPGVATLPTGNENRYGVTDETGKCNPNAFMMIDPTGTLLTNFLTNLPNIYQNATVVPSIMDWLDYDMTPLTGGDETYPGYSNRNGPADTIEELLQVQGVTPTIMYGNDRNRNGRFDSGDDSSLGSTYVPGLWDYMTTYSRELLVTPQGLPMAWLNDTPANLNIGPMSTAPNLGTSMINFVLLARQNGVTAISSGGSSGNSGSSGGGNSGGGGGGGTGGGTGGGGGTGSNTVQQVGNLSSPPSSDLNLTGAAVGSNPGTFTKLNITSIWQLVNTTVVCTSTATTPSAGGKGKSTTTTTVTTYTSPLSTTGDLTPLIEMFLYTTPWGSTSSLGGSGGKGGSGGSSGSGSSSGSSGSSSSNGSSSTATATATGPPLAALSYERPARVNINTCHPDVLQALFSAIPSGGSGGGSGSSGGSTTGSTTTSSTTTSSTGTSSQNAALMLLVPLILQNRPPLGQAGSNATYLTPAWLLANNVNMTPQQLTQLDPYITTASQVFRVQSVGVLDGHGATSARVEAVIDLNGGLPRILSWRDLSGLPNPSPNSK